MSVRAFDRVARGGGPGGTQSPRPPREPNTDQRTARVAEENLGRWVPAPPQNMQGRSCVVCGRHDNAMPPYNPETQHPPAFGERALGMCGEQPMHFGCYLNRIGLR